MALMKDFSAGWKTLRRRIYKASSFQSPFFPLLLPFLTFPALLFLLPPLLDKIVPL
ncbi:hypothetical protein BDV24DRAFT_85854 [Aspergillus arachidicola]|uniref:Uncharacterized protein n=1 Tax=Aspergillus arachidicola TaxID=656916 RepID=A0A5N6Y4G6_9EURO|nr:hypothetical protein BDV24DRAFT_85854 [Aspergillus arachidicola]